MIAPAHIYVSGPMRDHEGFNFPAFFTAETALHAMFPEADICNPAREDIVRFNLQPMLAEDPTGLSAGLYMQNGCGGAPFGEPELREALGQDLHYITRYCDLLVLLPGWEKSKGATAEAAAAAAVGCKVVEYDLWRQDVVTEENAVPVYTIEMPELHDFGSTSRPGETRTTSSSGGEKGVKLAAFDQISPEVEWLVAEHFGKGARKYAAHNFRKGYEWSKSYSALRRHLADFWRGKEYDVCPDDREGCQEWDSEHRFCVGFTERGRTCYNHTGSLHIVAVIWHAMVLAEFYLHHKEFDDRYVYPEED